MTPERYDASDDRLLRAEELAERLNCSSRQVWRLERAGKIPGGQRITSRMVRWSAAEIAAWFDAGRPPRDEWVHRWGAIQAQRKSRLRTSRPLVSFSGQEFPAKRLATDSTVDATHGPNGRLP